MSSDSTNPTPEQVQAALKFLNRRDGAFVADDPQVLVLAALLAERERLADIKARIDTLATVSGSCGIVLGERLILKSSVDAMLSEWRSIQRAQLKEAK